MRIEIPQQTIWRDASRTRGLAQLFRVTPKDLPGQKLLEWRVVVQRGGSLSEFVDGFGNRVHLHTLDDWLSQVSIAIEGVVETSAEVLQGRSPEPLPTAFFLRRTQLQGECSNPVHAFVDAARSLGKPARFVSGFLHPGGGEERPVAHHTWAETWRPEVGWLGFDPILGVPQDERYVRTAVGLDAEDTALVRSIRRGEPDPDALLHLRMQQFAEQ